MSRSDLLKKTEEARQCMERAVHDEFVKKAKLGQDVIISRGGKPYRIPASEALLIQEEEGGDYKTGSNQP
ncbi:MAG: hypothetical protein AB7E95_13445 [Kiritimatiellales bacterium]